MHKLHSILESRICAWDLALGSLCEFFSPMLGMLKYPIAYFSVELIWVNVGIREDKWWAMATVPQI